MLHLVLPILLAALSCLPLSSHAESSITSDWPQFLGPNRDGISPETGWKAEWPEEGPPILWRAGVGTGYSSVAVVGERAYTMGNVGGQETVYCLDANTGEVVWKHSYPADLYALYNDGGPACTPLIAGDSVYTLGRGGVALRLNRESGKVEWQKNLPKEFSLEVEDFGISCSPMLEGDQLILDPGAMMALKRTDGSLIWKAPPVPRAFTSPMAFTLDGKRLGATLNGDGLWVFEVDSGKEVCRHPWETFDRTNCTTPVVSGNKVFVSSGYDRGGAVLEIGLGKEPKVIWDNRNMRNHFNISVLWRDHLYGFDGNVNRDNQGQLRCVDFKTGEAEWTEDTVAKGGLLISDGKIVAISDKGELTIAEASPEGFNPTTRLQVLGGKTWTPPTLARGRIYCRNSSGEIACIDVRARN
ncbi:MAG: PQQ-binding-like beta-propeller repeat protein [Candidatus Omnitrophica bacterium]|nr:PQQ-binding-like beta-propeller repeat protein [Candidatus Omnitrophota bacterium]